MVFHLWKCDAMYKENDNLNYKEIEKYRKMSREDREKLMKEKEEEVKKKMASKSEVPPQS